MTRNRKLEWATGVLLAASAWTSVAHAGACVASGSPYRCARNVSAGSAASVPAPAAPASRAGVHVANINTTPQGQTYGRWAAQWYQWMLGIPAARNPLFDATGANCAERQVDNVWFLVGSGAPGSVVRSCTIPAQKALFFPLINSAFVAFLNDPAPARTEDFVRAQAACTLPVDIEAWIDGVKIQKPTSYFTGPGGSLSPVFTAQLPPGNIFGADETVIEELVLTPSAEQGYYLFVDPLPAGSHVIRWLASGCTPGNPAQDITYHLLVQ
jgi:hypothetical protein